MDGQPASFWNQVLETEPQKPPPSLHGRASRALRSFSGNPESAVWVSCSQPDKTTPSNGTPVPPTPGVLSSCFPGRHAERTQLLTKDLVSCHLLHMSVIGGKGVTPHLLTSRKHFKREDASEQELTRRAQRSMQSGSKARGQREEQRTWGRELLLGRDNGICSSSWWEVR